MSTLPDGDFPKMALRTIALDTLPLPRHPSFPEAPGEDIRTLTVQGRNAVSQAFSTPPTERRTDANPLQTGCTEPWGIYSVQFYSSTLVL